MRHTGLVQRGIAGVSISRLPVDAHRELARVPKARARIRIRRACDINERARSLPV